MATEEDRAILSKIENWRMKFFLWIGLPVIAAMGMMFGAFDLVPPFRRVGMLEQLAVQGACLDVGDDHVGGQLLGLRPEEQADGEDRGRAREPERRRLRPDPRREQRRRRRGGLAGGRRR